MTSQKRNPCILFQPTSTTCPAWRNDIAAHRPPIPAPTTITLRGISPKTVNRSKLTRVQRKTRRCVFYVLTPSMSSVAVLCSVMGWAPDSQQYAWLGNSPCTMMILMTLMTLLLFDIGIQVLRVFHSRLDAHAKASP